MVKVILNEKADPLPLVVDQPAGTMFVYCNTAWVKVEGNRAMDLSDGIFGSFYDERCRVIKELKEV